MNNDITNLQGSGAKLVAQPPLRLVNSSLQNNEINSKKSDSMVDEANKSKEEPKEGTIKKVISLNELKAAAQEGDLVFQSIQRDLTFQVDSEAERVVVRIVDSKSGELIRQIPTEDMLEYIKHIKEMEGNKGAVLLEKV